ncbi:MULTISPECIES: adenylate/guanylate cyclase domain-containing protein [unclassified Coleofasciculus]|uniref:adenylate/guanylate cyclase domain-containing protein n=1 Tax=unclassified Coleofasciculus TaxID=2692782 RepID=UPI0018827B7F|nr:MULTISPECIES: adenylate/guanylate cyclase domain-containing protein [unclassified Coleofasciculus]MBE9126991.1 adenylate/guanylate cyclase domain-containing response regulator [Coleofasciculus sp. LEGE 07081]MBE9150326.1 adenylate/guanylate cyclase domain-containing response regulator [Coleofasciculus sp. LEGE 07092]
MLEETQNQPNKENEDELIFADEDDEELFLCEEDNEELSSTNTKKDNLIFADNSPLPLSTKNTWKIIMVDDEAEIHKVTKLVLNDFIFENKSITFISAYSGEEAKALIEQHPDTALILLDVVMETDDAGLEVVKYIREVLNNLIVRIILRTGQPGQAPEDVVIINYDINDYKTKTELTTRKLFTALITALRAFRALTKLEESRRKLAQIVQASARFVPRQFLHFLHKDSIVDAKLGDSVQAKMSILFADIRSFTSLSETMSPQENFDFINSYLRQVGPVVRQHNGFIDKYIGDAVMALFPETPDDAITAAIDMQKQVAVHNEYHKNSNYLPISIGIGIHTGNLMLGIIGEEERMESTVISDAVNLACRLEQLTKLYGAGIIISGQTLSQLDDPQKYTCRFLDRVTVRGKQTPVAVFEIYDSDPQFLQELKAQTKIDFEQGVWLYYQEKFQTAQQHFERVLQVNDGDLATRLYLERCELSQQTGLALKWEEIDIFRQKT